MDEEGKIKECYSEMYRAMIAKDLPALSKVLADSFTLVHMTGLCQSKAEFVGAVGNGTLNYHEAHHHAMDVEIQGDCGFIVGQSLVTAAVFGGGVHTWRLQQDISLVKEKGLWVMTLAKASTY